VDPVSPNPKKKDLKEAGDTLSSTEQLILLLKHIAFMFRAEIKVRHETSRSKRQAKFSFSLDFWRNSKSEKNEIQQILTTKIKVFFFFERIFFLRRIGDP
jgi:hypothetical protein